MTKETRLTRIRGLRASIAALIVVLLVVTGCADTNGTAGNGASATDTTPSTTDALQTSGGSAEAVVTPSPEQMAPDAASPGADTDASPSAAGATQSVTPATDEASDAEYTYTDTGLAQGGGGGNNQVRVINQTDGKLRIKANVQLNRIPGPRVAPTNLAYAYASCADCQTIAIALQINLISRTASYVAPENLAIAINFECSNCYTVARAIQYTYSVDDPTQVPREVDELIRELDKELQEIRKEKDLSIEEIEQRINAVIAQFKELAESLKDDRDETTERTSPGATPIADDGTPTPDGSPTPADATETAATPSTSPSAVPSATAGAPTPTPDAAATPTP